MLIWFLFVLAMYVLLMLALARQLSMAAEGVLLLVFVKGVSR